MASLKMLMQSLESIAQKIQPGVVINFEKIGPNPDPVIREGRCRPFIYMINIKYFQMVQNRFLKF